MDLPSTVDALLVFTNITICILIHFLLYTNIIKILLIYTIPCCVESSSRAAQLQVNSTRSHETALACKNVKSNDCLSDEIALTYNILSRVMSNIRHLYRPAIRINPKQCSPRRPSAPRKIPIAYSMRATASYSGKCCSAPLKLFLTPPTTSQSHQEGKRIERWERGQKKIQSKKNSGRTKGA